MTDYYQRLMGGGQTAPAAPAAPTRDYYARVVPQAPMAPVAPEPAEDFRRGLAREALGGAAFGFGDEVTGSVAGAAVESTGAGEAAVRAILPVGAFETVGQALFPSANDAPPSPALQRFRATRDAIINMERGASERFTAENPVAAGGAMLGGALLGGGPVLAGLRAAKVPTTGVKGVMASGAGLGGVAGAGAGEGDMLERAGDVAEGAATGAAVGVLGATVGSIAQATFRAMAPGVQNRLAALAESSGLTPGQIETRLNALGPRATLADVNMVFARAADVAASKLGPTAARVSALIRRDESQFGRLMEPIRRTLGGRDAGVQTVQGLKDLRSQQASPLYEQAFAEGVQMTPRLRDLLGRPETRAAWTKAQKLGRSDPDVDVAQFGQGDPSLRGWQEITEHLADKVTALRKAGKAKAAGILGRLRKEIQVELDQQNPTYAEARALWASTKQADDMLELGEAALTPKMRPSELREAVSQMSNADRAFFRMGLGRAIEEKLATATDTNDLARMFRNPAMREKVYMAFPDRVSGTDFINTVRAETLKKATTNKVGRGSDTFARTEANKQLGGAPIGPEDLTQSGMAARAWAGLKQPRERTIQELGELLLAQDPATQRRALEIIRSVQERPTLAAGPVSAAAVNALAQSGAGNYFSRP